MKFAEPLIAATLIARYKRFLADVYLQDGQKLTVHCPNTGSMKSCGQAGDTIYLSAQRSAKRKLPYTWELSQCQQGYIGVNTNRSNGLVVEGLKQGLVPELAGYSCLRQEVPYGENSRIDILLEEGAKRCWVEVKNVTMLEGQRLLFPDAVTLRGRKHLQELQKRVEAGDRAVIFFLINRPDGECFSPAQEIDPAYSRQLQAAVQAGVEVLAYRVQASPWEMRLDRPFTAITISDG